MTDTAQLAFKRLDKILYINLAHREDRKREVLAELNRVQCPTELIERVEAVKLQLPKDHPAYACAGYLGCGKSHLAAMERIQQNPQWNHVLVLEDDFSFETDTALVWKVLTSAFTDLSWDVFMLTTTSPYPERQGCNRAFATKITEATGAAGYIVSRPYLDKMLACYRESTSGLERTGRLNPYVNDHAWQVLQANDRWLLADPIIGYQRPSHSDNCDGLVDYHQRRPGITPQPVPRVSRPPHYLRLHPKSH